MERGLRHRIRPPVGLPIDFRSRRGRQVWENVRDATGLLRDVRLYDGLEGRRKERAKRRLIAFTYMAAFRHEIDPPLSGGEFLKIVHTQAQHDGDLFRVAAYDRERTLVFDDAEVPIGRLNGYTHLMPLTGAAFDEFAGSDMPPEELCGGHMLIDGAVPRPHPHLYVASLVHLPSLRNEPDVRDPEARRVTAQLFEHIGSWITPFDFDGRRDRFVPRRRGDQLPRLLCLRDGRGMADPLIVGTGFRSCHAWDRLGGMEKYILDFGYYNNGSIGDEIGRRHIRRIHSQLARYFTS